METFEEYLRREKSFRVSCDMSPNIPDNLYIELKEKYDKMTKEPLLVLCEKIIKENKCGL